MSLLIGASLVAGLYAAVQFGPAYYRKWQAKEALSEAAVGYVNRAGRRGLVSTEVVYRLRLETEKRLRNIVVPDQGVRVRFASAGGYVTVTAEYQEVVNHPLVKKRTTLRFRPSVRREIRRARW